MRLQIFTLLIFIGLLDLDLARSFYEDISFNKELVVNNRTVSCSGTPLGRKYTQEMYTCTDIRVDGQPVFHGNNDFKEQNNDIPNNNGCPGCPCGSYTSQPNDVLALCSAMLNAQGVHADLEAAYAPKPVCNQTQAEMRVRFYIEDGTEKWLDSTVNNGYLSHLQCSLRDRVESL
ncbi:uncharacterized protein [Watersipora subatra]|uniref:uncharacterized protein n=1 Tax=Watersipora subatra TaxID=2589382 RepID=UPI00355AD455